MRKTSTVVIDEEGRDRGKRFVITEMSAAQAEAWAIRALLAMAAGGIELPDGYEQTGMAGLAEVGLRAITKLKWADAEPLLAEMMDCVQIAPDPRHPGTVRPLIDEDIEEIATRLKLRTEVFKLHTGFLKAADSQDDQAPAARSAEPSHTQARR